MSPDTPSRALNVTTAFVAFLVYWGVVSFFILSWASEKMPWLIVHLTVPWVLLGARYAGRVLESIDWRAWWRRGGAVTLLLIPVGLLAIVSLLNLQPLRQEALDGLDKMMRNIGALVTLGIAGGGLFVIGHRLGWRAVGHSAFVLLLVALCGLTVRFSMMAAHKNIDYPTEWIRYAGSTPDSLRVHFKMVVALLAIIITLILRPSGLFGRQKELEERV